MNSTECLTSKQAAEMLGISISTLYRMTESGILSPFRTPGGQRRYNKELLEKYIEDSKNIIAPQNPHLQKQAAEVVPQEYAEERKPVDPRNKLNDLPGKEWIQETKSYMFQKGLGANHPEARIERQHPAPFSFQDIGRLISFFTKAGQTVLDPFGGVGSTIKACALQGRKGVQIELSEKWHSLAIQRISTEITPEEVPNHRFILGDSIQELPRFDSESVDFVVTSPPYWSILNKKLDHKTKTRAEQSLATHYSDSEKDLGNICDYEEFLSILVKNVFCECGRILKRDKYICIVVSDFRNNSEFVSFHSDLISRLNHHELTDGFEFQLQGTKVLLQNHKSLLPYGYPFTYVENIHHQYILIFRKVKQKQGK
ncbi:DNA methyltransferase [Candidatus Agathobaculum pullicola]|uniref:DNA methyltransferase n=1 Tax=Candidatus Agathobaculum pullicola TaxID=2838426 RepID=UPI001F371561|nr:helix-turn-helix domain-containing protein [Oscillibacter valericigenes]